MKSIIEVEKLSKKYRYGEDQKYYTFRDSFVGLFKPNAKKFIKNEFWALKNITFRVKPGETLGIIGPNGAGKSTLLKILSRITPPTEGKAVLRGRVGSLLEVGTGFHQELTGRENIYLNGAILGMKRKEINKKFDEIVDFSGIEKFLDTPVKRYSSGMYMRLAFSVAAHLDSDILIVDEVLSVGDAEFQKKSFQKMENVADSGKTILFVSHNLGAINELCNESILLRDGDIVLKGKTSSIVSHYIKTGSEEPVVNFKHERESKYHIFKIELKDKLDQLRKVFDINEAIKISVEYGIQKNISGLRLSITIKSPTTEILQTFDTDKNDKIPIRTPGLYKATLTLPSMFLKQGDYVIDIFAGSQGELLFKKDNILKFRVDELSTNTHSKGYDKRWPGLIISPGNWNTKKLTSRYNL